MAAMEQSVATCCVSPVLPLFRARLDNISVADTASRLGSPLLAASPDLDSSTIIKTRNKHVWLKPGVTVDEAHKMTEIATKDDWVNEDERFFSRQNLIWAQRKKAIEYVAETDDDPAQALTRAQNHLELVDYNTILRRLATYRKWHRVYLVFEWMKQNEKLSPPSFTTFMSSMGKAGYPYRALQAFRSETDPVIRLNVIVCNALFKALIFNGKVDSAFILFEQLKREGLVPNFETYKRLIAGCARHRGAYAKADKYLQEMVAMGLQPDSFIFTSLLSVCASFGLEDEAKATLDKMKEVGVAANHYHYCALLNLYAEIRKPAEAEKLFSEVQQRHMPLDKTILSCMLKVYTNSGLLKEARICFDGMEALGFPPQEVSYCLMMDAYVKAGKVNEAHKLFDEMKANVVKIGCYTYGILISAYSKMRNVDAVESLVAELDSLPKGSMDVVLFNNLMKTYCELGIMEGILKTMKKMDEERVAPDRATFNILITYFSKEELLDLARGTLQDLINRRLRPNLYSYVPIISGLLRAGNIDEAFVLYNQMKEFNIAASLPLLEDFMESLCKLNRVEEAVRFLKDFKANDLSPKSTLLESLFISVRGNMELANDIFEASDETNLKAVNFDSVLTFFEDQGCLDAIPRMLELMKRHGCFASKVALNDLQGRLDEGHVPEDISELVDHAGSLF